MLHWGWTPCASELSSLALAAGAVSQWQGTWFPRDTIHLQAGLILKFVPQWICSLGLICIPWIGEMTGIGEEWRELEKNMWIGKGCRELRTNDVNVHSRHWYNYILGLRYVALLCDTYFHEYIGEHKQYFTVYRIPCQFDVYMNLNACDDVYIYDRSVTLEHQSVLPNPVHDTRQIGFVFTWLWRLPPEARLPNALLRNGPEVSDHEPCSSVHAINDT